MSIRNKIFLPLLAALVIAASLSYWISVEADKGRGILSSVIERALEGAEANRKAMVDFGRAQEIVDQVTAMTILMDRDTIEATFSTHAGFFGKDIERLQKVVLSEEMGDVVSGLAAEYEAWRKDAEILLGITPAGEIPTAELMNGHSQRLTENLLTIADLSARDARVGLREAGEAMSSKIATALLIVLAAALAGAAGAFLIARGLSRPLVRLSVDAEKLAGGDTSIEFVGLKRKDEIGATARAIAGFRDGVVERAKLAEEAAREQSARERRQQAVEELIKAFRGKATELLGAVDQETGKMTSTAKALSGISEKTRETADGASSASGDASRNVEVVAAATEELVASIGNIEGQVEQARSIIGKANQGARATNEKMSGLAEAAARIGQVVDLIQDIAEQTNLLALNATIEAARAGEAGRGFSVVASEVKTLANQTAKATDEIASQIASIQGATGDAASAISAITETMEEVNSYAAAIGDAMTEQSTATAEISRNVAQAATRTQSVGENIKAVTAAAGDTNRSADDLAGAANSTAARVSELRETVDSFLKQVGAA
jgi:methyl-accepting chemotaxis protein